ncbi:MAG: Crp/Fnr family transcriptional regulator [Gemmatimonadota bacterium]
MALSRRRQPDDLADTLRGFEFFEGIGDEELQELAGLALCHDYPKNNILSYRGDPAAAVFLVVSGRVKIILTNDEGREVIVSLLGPGGMFGLSSALDGGDQLASAVTIEPAAIAKFNGKAFTSWADSSPGPRAALVRELNRRVRELNRKIGSHALLSAKDRLLFTLMEIADAEGEQEPGSTKVTFTRPTHQELANRIGSSREVVTRLLAELLDSELLEADEGRIIRVPLSSLVLRED